jgi:hypothetical protein
MDSSIFSHHSQPPSYSSQTYHSLSTHSPSAIYSRRISQIPSSMFTSSNLKHYPISSNFLTHHPTPPPTTNSTTELVISYSITPTTYYYLHFNCYSMHPLPPLTTTTTTTPANEIVIMFLIMYSMVTTTLRAPNLIDSKIPVYHHLILNLHHLFMMVIESIWYSITTPTITFIMIIEITTTVTTVINFTVELAIINVGLI